MDQTRENLMVLASIDKIQDVPNTDNLQIATVHGMAWNVIINRNDGIKENDLVVYFSIDAMIGPIVEKMMESSVMTDETKTFLSQFLKKPIRTKKIRGVWSQGLIFPLSYLEKYGIHVDEEKLDNDYLDLTSKFGITKYISAEEENSYTEGSKFPVELVMKTDEKRIQNEPKLLQQIQDKDIVVTRKEDGSSATYILYRGVFMICSRNFIVTGYKSESSYYHEVEKMFSIEEKMKTLGRNLAIQGEVVGPKINGNRLKLMEFDYRIFNIFDIDTKTYLDWNEVKDICHNNSWHTVPELYQGKCKMEWIDVKNLLSYASTIKYATKIPAEGIVIKTLNRSISFKVISNEYLLKNNL